ncbi:MAG TPA: hypothetical protein DDY43_07755 [Synechococcales bacterium UBA10510]|nr:hypothetical protein [Synechococcales bacterium UBA10510]
MLPTIGNTLQFLISCNQWFPTPGSIAGLIGLLRQHSQFAPQRYLVLLWVYGQGFCCEQLFRDQNSGIFQLESSGLRDPERIDRLLLVVAIAVLAGSLQRFAVSLIGE